MGTNKKANEKLQEYELLFDNDPVNTLKKMIDLFPLLDPFDAASFDSILLWMYYKGNREIANYIRKKIKEDQSNKTLYQKLLNSITGRFQIHFCPRPLEEIIPVGQEPNQYLTWFYFTDGSLWLTAGEDTIYEYNQDFTYNEYYQVRFLEDFTALFTSISQSIP